MAIQVQVDATRAISKLTRLPEAVRENLRRLIPQEIHRLAVRVNQKLDSGLKSRRSLQVQESFDDSSLYGAVTVVSTKEPSFLPQILEAGARPHIIEGNPRLYFFSEELGHIIAPFRVHHPGFRGIHYMEESANELRRDILRDLERAVREGARDATK